MQLFVELPPVVLPGPRPMPLVGARGNLIRFLAKPVQAMLRLQRQYGDVAPLTRDDPGWLLAIGSAHNREVLTNGDRFHNLADHPVKLPAGSAAAKFSLSLVNQNGLAHQHGRRLIQPLFAKHRLATYARMTADTTARTLDRLAVGQQLDAHSLCVELSLSVALRCLFDVDATAAGGPSDDLGELVLDYLSRVFSPANMLLPVNVPGTPFRRFLTTSERLGDRVEQMIRERRERSAGDDMLSALITAYASEPDQRSSEAVDDELLGQVAMLLIAGHDTSAHTLAWTLFLLTQHPEIQAALIDEVDGVDVHDHAAVMALPLLDRVIKESMRLLSAVALLFFRRSTDSFTLGGHELPAGATVILSPLISHRDESVFPEPRRFVPDRWLSCSPGPYEYMPYGAGPRLCVGMSLGAQIQRVILVMLLRRFRVSLAAGARVSYTTRGVLMGPLPGMTVDLLARDRGGAPAGKRVRGNIHELVDLS
ncbi:cytochrome P450 [Enhygromyxa salina]|uniref:Epi-isozizaene 5-monooxygenase/(E)-beta-farnesene synthase n=1 Tax=Enhygromyxa salina TaxID=215803 RepID=A0A2S9XU43_9BACT|nr:cytochrome P450 [Enhygromyxa salina]PRP96386.1 Epi-isozizaene 5-monooxygenase/(E)-beta-farnesene synthase [Enhygromyxa salina]